MKKRIQVFNLIFITIPAILLALLIAEGALRATGYIYTIAIKGYPVNGVYQKKQHSILCVGDSFTWGLGALPEKSYPMQLKELLEQNCNSSITVYNAGVPGSNSSLVLKSLHENINKYTPDFIVIMVGSNNAWNLEDSSYFLLRKIRPNYLNYFERILSKMKVYKLAKIWYLTIRHKEPSSLEKDTSVSINPNSITALQAGLVLFDEAKYELAAEYFDKALLLDPHNYLALMRKAEMLAVRKDYVSAKDALNKAAGLIDYFNIKDINFFLRTMTVVLINLNERIEMLGKLKLLTKEYVNDGKKNKLFLETLAAQEELLKDVSLYNEILFFDLSQIISLAHQKNIKVILQTYPYNGDINTTIRKVSQMYALPLVDNQKIFEEKSKYMQIKDLFVSMYDNHCNALGYRLVAVNIYNVLVQNNYLPNCGKDKLHN